jgi:hypothetical protein
MRIFDRIDCFSGDDGRLRIYRTTAVGPARHRMRGAMFAAGGAGQ